MAGMLATTWPHFQETWDELCEPVLPWLCRCFFACTVGFAIPKEALGSDAAGLIVVTIVIAIISKFITGFLATGCQDPKFLATLARSAQPWLDVANWALCRFTPHTQTTFWASKAMPRQRMLS